MVTKDDISPEAVDAFIARWGSSGGSEISNAQSFINELCELLDLQKPDPSQENNQHNDYVFERAIKFKHGDGRSSNGRIDLYKRGCFVLEAKQSAKRQKQTALLTAQGDLLDPNEEKQGVKTGTALRDTRGWNASMLNARQQADGYARALPKEHGWPPFLVICDVGHCFELYADFSLQGKHYSQFPDRQGYRIALEDLRKPEIRQRLRTLWTKPLELDPAKRTAQVTRDIADLLAHLSKALEARDNDPTETAMFLMRCLFTMFAEDVELIKKDSFTKLIQEYKGIADRFHLAAEALWKVMNDGGFCPTIKADLLRFNGGLFADARAIRINEDDLKLLEIAARRDWQHVEPAIFGTLLERALDSRERSKLGAHYTPRVYVERLVVPTIIDPLSDDWKNAQAQAFDSLTKANQAEIELKRRNKELAKRDHSLSPKKNRQLVDLERSIRDHRQDAVDTIRAFHHKLCNIRVLDPACGTGNFLYVAMELMKRLEGDVLEFLADIDAKPDFLTVDPHQFLGLELNPRAVAIAELVLWIGYLQWHFRTHGKTLPAEPVLKDFENIKQQDAVLAYDRQELLTDETGKSITRWNGFTTKLHPITGEEVPDETAQVDSYKYLNPRPAKWPEADFIIGNPPFIGGKDMRQGLGDGYAEALWASRLHMPQSADFVMWWWDKAAELAANRKIRRFGFITTNSITQIFSRKVIEHHMRAKNPVSLLLAIPDHPWMKGSDRAAVRIAMTVGVAGERAGHLREVISEADLNTDAPKVKLSDRKGKVFADLTIGADITSAKPLKAGRALCSRGVSLHGAGFIVTPTEAIGLGLGKIDGLEHYIRPYFNGRDLAGTSRGVMVIDLFGLDENQVRTRFPAVYQRILERVKPERDQNNRETYRQNWWIFGEPRREFRPALKGISHFIATVETSKHRFFQLLDASIRPDNMLVNIGLEDAFAIAVLSSRMHVNWALAAGGKLEDRPRYNKSRCFDPFPFPDATEAQKTAIRALGEQLDTHRKGRQKTHPHLTMTGMYNVLEWVRELNFNPEAEPLTDTERDIHEQALISVLKQLHDDIDRAVLDAYGWSDLAPALIGRPGATMPIDNKPVEQREAEEELLTRLVALNHERAREEARGLVRWLRPEFQNPDNQKMKEIGEQMEATLTKADDKSKPKWPTPPAEQVDLLRTTLASEGTPMSPGELSNCFKGGRNRLDRVKELLDILTALGQARNEDNSYFIPGEDVS